MTSATDPAGKPRGASHIVGVIDGDPLVRRQVRALLESAGLQAVEFDGEAALVAGAPAQLDILLVGLVARGAAAKERLDCLRRLRSRHPLLPVVAITPREDVEVAVEAMRLGVDDCIPEPVERARFLAAIERAARRLVHAGVGGAGPARLIGSSPPMVEALRQVDRVRLTDVAVHIHGESGTGKELVARAIHEGSRRAAGPFVAINCAAIPASLQESDLFGHEKGSFTGAVGLHRGRFEQANNGTLFLDEIAEMSLATQASLLRAIQERTIRRVGGTQDVPVNLRIISATHRDLRAEVAAKRFREDLYFRLVVFPIDLPALRERAEDIPALAAHVLGSLGPSGRQQIERIAPEALLALARYDWPGNVRELQNVLQRAALACDGVEIDLEHLPKELRALVAAEPARRSALPPEGEPVLPMRELERRAIEHALRAAGGNISRAARLLGLSRATLYRRMLEFSLASAGDEPSGDEQSH